MDLAKDRTRAVERAKPGFYARVMDLAKDRTRAMLGLLTWLRIGLGL